MSDEKRSFSVVYENKKHVFKGTTPLSVSKKVITKLCKLYKKKEVKFELNETTKDSKKKKYGPYIGHIEDLKAKVCLVGGKGKGRPRGTPIHNLNLHHMEKKAKLRIKRSKSNESKLQDLYKSLYLGHHTHTNIYKEAVKGRIRMLEFKIKQKEQKQKEQEQEQLDQYINQPAFTEHGYRSSNKKPGKNDSRLKYSYRKKYLHNNDNNENNKNNENNENNENNGNNTSGNMLKSNTRGNINESNTRGNINENNNNENNDKAGQTPWNPGKSNGLKKQRRIEQESNRQEFREKLKKKWKEFIKKPINSLSEKNLQLVKTYESEFRFTPEEEKKYWLFIQ